MGWVHEEHLSGASRTQPVPFAEVALAHRSPRLRAAERITARTTAAFNRVTGTAERRAEASALLTWAPTARWTVNGIAAVAAPWGRSRVALGVGELRVTWRARNGGFIETGARVQWQRAALPVLPELREVASFVAVGFALAGERPSDPKRGGSSSDEEDGDMSGEGAAPLGPVPGAATRW
jgi:hypothetical protein